MGYGYDRRVAFEATKADLERRIDELVDIVIQRDMDRALPLYRKLFKDMGVVKKPRKSELAYYMKKPDHLAASLRRHLRDWENIQHQSRAIQATKPKAQELLRHVKAIQGLQRELERDPGAFYFRLALRRLELDDLESLLENFLD